MSKVGNYEIIKQIGEGGFARTYLARHTILGESACLKQNIDVRPEFTKVLLSEAKLLWHIHHHSLPTLRDIIAVGDGSYVMVMTFIEGMDLYKLVAEQYPKGLHPEHVCWITQRLLNALHYLHFHGIVHCDVKPQNIIVKPEDHNAVLVDYGISCRCPDRTSSSKGFTPQFAAPELMRDGAPPTPETDLFGLGVTMIYALGGDVLTKRLPSTVPDELQVFIGKLVRYDIHERPKTAEELIRPLSDIREKLFGRRSSGRKLEIRNNK